MFYLNIAHENIQRFIRAFYEFIVNYYLLFYEFTMCVVENISKFY